MFIYCVYTLCLFSVFRPYETGLYTGGIIVFIYRVYILCLYIVFIYCVYILCLFSVFRPYETGLYTGGIIVVMSNVSVEVTVISQQADNCRSSYAQISYTGLGMGGFTVAPIVE